MLLLFFLLFVIGVPLLLLYSMQSTVLIQLAAKKGHSQMLQSGLEVYKGLVQAQMSC